MLLADLSLVNNGLNYSTGSENTDPKQQNIRHNRQNECCKRSYFNLIINVRLNRSYFRLSAGCSDLTSDYDRLFSGLQEEILHSFYY